MRGQRQQQQHSKLLHHKSLIKPKSYFKEIIVVLSFLFVIFVVICNPQTSGIGGGGGIKKTFQNEKLSSTVSRDEEMNHTYSTITESASIAESKGRLVYMIEIFRLFIYLFSDYT